MSLNTYNYTNYYHKNKSLKLLWFPLISISVEGDFTKVKVVFNKWKNKVMLTTKNVMDPVSEAKLFL